jgi:nucleotide-binding universal stress UspA family protein
MRGRHHRIVVGLDGSAGSRAALRWAIGEARLTRSTIDVVTGYVPTYVPAAPDFGYMPLEPTDLVGEVERMQTNTVDEIVDECRGTDVTITRRVLKGRGADVVIEASADADMAIVGSRGRGGVRGLLLGSVSHHIAQHAPCPVVIVRSEHAAVSDPGPADAS